MAPPMTAPRTSSGEHPIPFPRLIAMAVKVAIVPQLVPIASEIKQETIKRPGSINFAGIKFRAIVTAESTYPIPWDMAAKEPARIKIRHMVIMVLSPMPCEKISIFSFNDRFRSRRMAKHAATTNAMDMGTQ